MPSDQKELDGLLESTGGLTWSSVIRMSISNVSIRMGRSMITLFGVVLGTAFLMSVITAGLLRSALVQKEASRTAAADAVAQVAAELGTLQGRTLGIIVQQWDDMTDAFIGQLGQQDQLQLQVYAPQFPRAAGLAPLVDRADDAVDGAAALIVCNHRASSRMPLPDELDRLGERMVMDLQGLYDQAQLQAAGVRYVYLLRRDVAPSLLGQSHQASDESAARAVGKLKAFAGQTLAVFIDQWDPFTASFLRQLIEKHRVRLRIHQGQTSGAEPAESSELAELGTVVDSQSEALAGTEAVIVCNHKAAAGSPLPLEMLVGKTVIDFQGVYDGRNLQEDRIGYLHLLDRPDSGMARMWWLIAVSLFVSGIGIANALLMSVTERFREIGTLKCLGAMDKLIVQLFVIESGMLGLVGSAIGVVIGFVLAVTGNAMTYGWSVVWSHLPGTHLAIFAAVSLFVGLTVAMVAAIYPATVAARMTSADAMRVDV